MNTSFEMTDFHLFYGSLDSILKRITSYRLVVALSGNKDSLVLTHLVVKWIKLNPQWKLRLVHFVHGNSKSDIASEQIVKSFAFKNELQLDVVEFKITNETQGSKFRKEYFSNNTAEDEVVLTGHHCDDSVESVLMNLFSGASINGVSGIKSIASIGNCTFIRPFIDAKFFQEDIDSLANMLHLNVGTDYVFDEMNYANHFKRNALRYIIIPAILKVFPFARNKIDDFAQNALEQQSLNAYLYEQTNKHLLIYPSVIDNIYNLGNIQQLIHTNKTVFKNWFFMHFKLKYEVTLNKSHYEQFLLFIKNLNTTECHLPCGIKIIRECVPAPRMKIIMAEK